MDKREYYSDTRRGFFPSCDREQYESSPLGWPEDAVEITLEYKEELFEKQGEGYEIIGDENGYPIAVLHEPTPSDLAKIKKEDLLGEADKVIQPMLGYAIAGILSEEEEASFKVWNQYRKDLEEIDTNIDSITWPKKPEV